MPPRAAIGPEERSKIQEVLDHYATLQVDFGYQGPFEEQYNDAFAAFMGGGYADAVATGTAALFIAVAALDLPKGSEVLVSPITDPGSLSAVILNGMVPRLVDSAPDSFNTGAEQVAARITDRTRAIMVVHSLGRAADVEGITGVARSHGLKVLEDCSQSHGARWNGRLVGTFGNIAAFSTMYRKASVTGASGGVVYSQDVDLYRRALAHADRGKPRWIKGFDDRNPSAFLFPALNLHTDEISCAIGVASLARLSDTISRRLSFVAAVAREIADASRVCKGYGYTAGDSPFVYPILVDAERLTCSKEVFARAVLAEGIGLNPHYQYLVRDWPWVQPYLADDFEPANARRIRDSAFCLYLNENYGNEEANDVARAIVKVEKHFAR
jgi:perosamine synthetase